MRTITFISLIFILTSCWPTSVSFVDTNMPEEWREFFVTTLDNQAPNTPLSYSATLSESIKDGIQNNSRLQLSNSSDEAQLNVTGTITSYNVSPVALQDGDAAAKNRLTVSVRFEIFVTVEGEEDDQMDLTSTRFVDYDSDKDLGSVENELLEEINTQIVQDIINKLNSNW